MFFIASSIFDAILWTHFDSSIILAAKIKTCYKKEYFSSFPLSFILGIRVGWKHSRNFRLFLRRLWSLGIDRFRIGGYSDSERIKMANL